MVNIEIVYVAADKSLIQRTLSLPLGATVDEAINKSGLLITHPEIRGLSIGIFSKQVTRETLLKPGDRIEIYRKLTLDPKEKRRALAKK